MAEDTYSPQLPETGTPQSLWSSLSRWWGAPAAVPVDAVGYESALPWALGDMSDAARKASHD